MAFLIAYIGAVATMALTHREKVSYLWEHRTGIKELIVNICYVLGMSAMAGIMGVALYMIVAPFDQLSDASVTTVRLAVIVIAVFVGTAVGTRITIIDRYMWKKKEVGFNQALRAFRK